jgi:CheY-like chemotaxis protein
MKILLLNPHADAERKITEAVSSRGHVLLSAADAQEAWQLLQVHGATIDLAVVHRETSDGKKTPGIDLLMRAKQDPVHHDLPLVLSSSVWGDAEFARHQGSDQAANAYLRWPFEGAHFLAVMDQILGPPSAPQDGTRLEDATHLYLPDSAPHQTLGSIRLDAPGEAASAAPPPLPEIELGPPAPPAGDGAREISGDEPVALSEPAPIPEPVPAPAFDPSQLEPAVDIQVEPQEPPSEAAPEIDEWIVGQMPYLSNNGTTGRRDGAASPMMGFAKAVGDAVIPGAAGKDPDLETMRQYLLLREQDVAVLSSQLKTARDRIRELEGTLNESRGANASLEHQVKEQGKQIEEFEREKQLALQGLRAELDEMKFQMKARSDRARVLESQVKDAHGEVERVKERVRVDLRKIRARERELESRIEIMKRDSEALIGARETKIIELKRKLDLLEFNMDLLQDQYRREKEHSELLRERLAKAAQVVRVAGGVLDSNESKAS